MDEHLTTSYRPDMEYVDGMLVERGMPTGLHSLFHAMLAEYFRSQRKLADELNET